MYVITSHAGGDETYDLYLSQTFYFADCRKATQVSFYACLIEARVQKDEGMHIQQKIKQNQKEKE